MRRAIVVALLLFARVASAQESEETEEPAEDPVAKQEIGVRVGAQIGFTDLTPGGFRLGGVYLYRMSEDTWFDGEVATSFGSGASACYYTRAEELTLTCNHGGVDGFSMAASAGVRLFLPRQTSGFHPYLRGGAGLSYLGFSGDDVSGVALQAQGGGGGRFRVAPRVAISGEALLLLGPALYNSELGLRLVGGLIVQFGVEFAL